MEGLPSLVTAGSAGAVIVSIILFLRFMATQRSEDRAERMAERAMWSSVIQHHEEALKDNSIRLAHSLDRFADRIDACPQNRSPKEERN
jgi:hypothetical protein